MPSTATVPLSAAEARRVLFQLTLIRAFEERVLKLVSDGSIRGTTHPYVGQEAVAVGACLALRGDDWVVSTHRGHGHLLAKGGDPNRLMAELFGKATGYGGGKGGTQHMADYAVGHLGSNGITGGGIPIGTGAALSAQLRRSGQVVVIFFGDGAATQGTFHESLNLAALWRLPAVYVCENNLYAMSTPVREACAVEHIADRAAAYGMPGVQVDGMDVLAVAVAVRAAVGRLELLGQFGESVGASCREHQIGSCGGQLLRQRAPNPRACSCDQCPFAAPCVHAKRLPGSDRPKRDRTQPRMLRSAFACRQEKRSMGRKIYVRSALRFRHHQLAQALAFFLQLVTLCLQLIALRLDAVQQALRPDELGRQQRQSEDDRGYSGPRSGQHDHAEHKHRKSEHDLHEALGAP